MRRGNMEGTKWKRKKVTLGEVEKRGLRLLLTCFLLFLCVFLGRGGLPESWRGAVVALLEQRVPLPGVFAELGQAVAGKETWGHMELALLEEESPKLCLPRPVAAREQIRVLPLWNKGKSVEEGVTAAEEVPLGLQKTVDPVVGVVSSAFGLRFHPIDEVERQHNGIDVAAEAGTEILAFADGVVEYIGESEELGQYLRIRHNADTSTFYAHCSRLLVSTGQSVPAGQVVALVGSTGRSTGPHLHFELEQGGHPVDPLPYLEALV